MSSLLSLLEQESRKRGFLDDGESLTPERSFSLIRDMPYRRASSRRPGAIINEWRGTCSGKHYLLADIFRGFGLESQVVMCTHRFTPDNTRHFPSELRELVADSPIPDVHTYLQVNTAPGLDCCRRDLAQQRRAAGHDRKPVLQSRQRHDPGL